MLHDLVNRFATLTSPVAMKRYEPPDAGGKAVVSTVHTALAGTTVRVVSYFTSGEVGVTDVLEGAYAHGCRVRPEELAHLRHTSEPAPARAECDAHHGEGLIRMRCHNEKCGRRLCDECTMDDELSTGLCFYCQPKKGLRRK